MKQFYEKPEVELIRFVTIESITDDEGEIPGIDGSGDVEEW